MRKAGWYGLNSEGLGCGTLADFCDYSTYSSGSVKVRGGGGGFFNPKGGPWAVDRGFFLLRF